MYILGCGSRTWLDFVSIRDALIWVPEGSTIVHGAQTGADTCFDVEGRNLGFRVVPVPADWGHLGSSAGPIRNDWMLEIMKKARRKGHEVLVLAFHEDPSLGSGTRNMVKKCLREGFPVIIFLKHPFVS